MAIYTVHEPLPRADEAAADPARFVFVRDGFHFWAFLLGPLWMLWHRLWLVLVLYIVFSGVFHTALWWVGMSANMRFLAGFLVSILVGLEAPTLRRWTLGRRGWTTAGVVAADDAESAERRFFDAWADRAPRGYRESARPPEAFQAPLAQQPTVIGLFPEPGAHR